MSVPGSTTIRRAVLAASIGTMIEGYDVLIYGYLATILAERFFPADDPTAGLLNTLAIFAVGFAVRPLGGLLFGHVGDRFGRRPALAASIVLMAAATLAIGLLPTYRQVGLLAPVLLLFFRLVQGFSIGGEYAGANIFVLEYTSAGRFGRAVSINQVGAYLGAAGAAGTSLALSGLLHPAQMTAWGWRLPFVAAVPLGLIGLYLRVRVLDSPAFRAAAGQRERFPLRATVRTAWREMLVYAGWTAMVTVGGYVLFGYLPTYLIRVAGLDRTTAFAANLGAMLGLAAAAVAGGYLVDRYSTRLIAVVSAAVVAVAVVPGFALLNLGGALPALLGQLVWGVGIGVGATVSGVLSIALFPLPIRYTATAFAYNFTVTLLGGTAPYVSAWLIGRTGSPSAPAWYLALVATTGLVSGALGMRARRAPATTERPPAQPAGHPAN